MNNELLEKVSKYIHENIWMRWTKGLIADSHVSDEKKESWKKLHIPYEQLSEEEKDKDREIARGLISIIGKQTRVVYTDYPNY